MAENSWQKASQQQAGFRFQKRSRARCVSIRWKLVVILGARFLLAYLCSGEMNCYDTFYTYHTRYFFLSCTEIENVSLDLR